MLPRPVVILESAIKGRRALLERGRAKTETVLRISHPRPCPAVLDGLRHYRKWTPEELAMIGTMPDREVARRINRSLSAVKAKKFMA